MNYNGHVGRGATVQRQKIVYPIVTQFIQQNVFRLNFGRWYFLNEWAVGYN